MTNPFPETNSHVQVAGMAGYWGCFWLLWDGEADETPIGFPGGLVSGGLIPELQAPSFLVEIEDMNKGYQRN